MSDTVHGDVIVGCSKCTRGVAFGAPGANDALCHPCRAKDTKKAQQPKTDSAGEVSR